VLKLLQTKWVLVKDRTRRPIPQNCQVILHIYSIEHSRLGEAKIGPISPFEHGRASVQFFYASLWVVLGLVLPIQLLLIEMKAPHIVYFDHLLGSIQLVRSDLLRRDVWQRLVGVLTIWLRENVLSFVSWVLLLLLAWTPDGRAVLYLV